MCVIYLCHSIGLFYWHPHNSSRIASLTDVDETSRSRQYVHNRLGILTAAGYLENIHANTALYELVGDSLADEENGG